MLVLGCEVGSIGVVYAIVKLQLRRGASMVTSCSPGSTRQWIGFARQFAIIYFGNDWFAENRTSSHHVAERLSQRTRVLYVDSPGFGRQRRTAAICGSSVASCCRRAAAATVGDRLWQMSVPQILPAPAVCSASERRAGQAPGQAGVETARIARERCRGSRSPIRLSGERLRRGRGRLLLHRRLRSMPDVDARRRRRDGSHLTSRADQVFVVLADAAGKAAIEASTRSLRMEWTSRSSDGIGSGSFDRTGRRNPRPVVGFYGLIEEWIDLDLIADLAERRPRWTFLMIGRLAVDAGRLKALPNVVFAGPQPYRSLPTGRRRSTLPSSRIADPSGRTRPR